MNRRQRVVVAAVVAAASISLAFGFVPFAATLRVQLPFLDVGAAGAFVLREPPPQEGIEGP